MYCLYLYFFGLSLRKAAEAMELFKDQKRSYVAVWKWIQRFGSYQIYRRKTVPPFTIDETVIQIDNQHFLLWICIEHVKKSYLEFKY